MKTIRIEPKGHFYLNDHAITEFVVDYNVDSKEIVTVRIRGKIEIVKDEVEENEVKDGNR